MKGFQIVQTGSADKAFELKELPEPSRKAGEVKIKVEAFGLNYADVMCRHGLYREAPPRPFVPGYEVVGSVIESDDTSLVGKRVVAFTRFGGYAEVVVTSIEAIVVIGSDVPAGEAVALGTQYVTAYYAAYEMINLHEGDNVLIQAAAGGVGVALTQLAKLKGCTVFGTASRSNKLEFIKSNGVDHTINYVDSDYEEAVRKILKGNRIDVAFNSVGGSTFKKDKRLLGFGGRQVLYGLAERSGKRFGLLSTLSVIFKMGRLIPVGFLMKSQGLIGVNMLKVADHKPEMLHHCLQEVYKLYEQDKIKPRVGGSFKADQLAEAHQLLEGRDSIGKIVVVW